MPGGCAGGDVLDAWYRIADFGVTSEENYEYKSGETNQTFECEISDDEYELRECPQESSKNVHRFWKSTEPIRLACEEDIQREIINNGPVQAFLNVSHDFFHYKSGIYHKTMDPPNNELISIMTHSVMILGWGEENGQKFWIGRNSWGEYDENDSDSHWGECTQGIVETFYFDKFSISSRSKKAGRFKKLLGSARSHFIVTRGSVSLSCATTLHPSRFSKSERYETSRSDLRI